ncbi:MAG: hypothetical protein FJ399_06320 [Verrucomicrobia bacterium]|nr:hypothetical protein [Verrucomicrobiota bacterium]
MNTPPTSGLHWIDGTIIIAYLGVLAGIGYYYSRKSHSLDEFIRGTGRYGWLTLGLSLMAALNSGMDYIQAPAIAFGIGMIYAGSVLSFLPLYPWVARVTLPFYKRLNTYSAYEYLELRFGVGVRLIAAAIFIFWRVGWMAGAIYVPCMAVNVVAGGQLDVPLTVAVLGIVVTLYTMAGGMKAVVWTDVAQFCVMMGGLAVTFWVVLAQVPDGVAEVARLAAQSGRLDFVARGAEAGVGFWGAIKHFFSTEITFTGIVFVVTLSRFTAFTSDQVTIQRLQSSASLADARRSFVVQAITDVVWIVVLGCVGLALFAYYQHHVYPAGMQNDRVLPHFMREHFPVGVVGLVIAAIFAASLSSVDAALNATASIVTVDFYNRLWLGGLRPLHDMPPEEQRRHLRVSRLATLGLGLLMVAIGVNVERMGELYSAANRLLGAFFGPLFGIFFLGMFSRRAHSAAVIVGALAGLASSCFASFFKTAAWLKGVSGALFGPAFVDFFDRLSWLWPSPIGVTVTLLVGFAASRLLPARRESDAPPLTFAEVMQRPEPAET